MLLCAYEANDFKAVNYTCVFLCVFFFLIINYFQEFSPEDYDYIVNGLKDKLGRVDEQRWGVFYAEKH